uniref:Uncharacterized protein n=1 Tax=Romanomermis culicivorax TaxID=13658 RepID=A0A915HI27_ROMCU
DNNRDSDLTIQNGLRASGVSTSSTTININGELKNIDVLLEDAVSSMPKPKYDPTANDPTVEDLLGLSSFMDEYELQPCSSTMLRCVPSKSLPKRVSPYEELMNLWEGSSPNISAPVDENLPIQNGTSFQNGTSCNKMSQNAIPLPSKSNVKNKDQPLNNSNSSLTQILVVDQACQPSDEDQLKDEIRILRDNPEILAKVVAHVATLSTETQQKFFLLLAQTD